jgi:hypothetical protein
VGASLSGSLNLGIFKVNISGSVSVHQNQTRSSDNSAKYHVDLHATNHGTPEGLARVLDIIAASAAPALLESKMVDANGKEVNAAAKQKRIAQQESYAAQQRIGTAYKAAQDQYEATIKSLKEAIGSFEKSQQLEMQRKLNGDAVDDAQRTKMTDILQKFNGIWDRVSADARSTVEAASLSTGGSGTAGAGGDAAAAAPPMKQYFEMKKIDDAGSSLVDVADTDINTMQDFFNGAVKNYKQFKEQEKALSDERANYNKLLMQK